MQNEDEEEILMNGAIARNLSNQLATHAIRWSNRGNLQPQIPPRLTLPSSTSNNEVVMPESTLNTNGINLQALRINQIEYELNIIYQPHQLSKLKVPELKALCIKHGLLQAGN